MGHLIEEFGVDVAKEINEGIGAYTFEKNIWGLVKNTFGVRDVEEDNKLFIFNTKDKDTFAEYLSMMYKLGTEHNVMADGPKLSDYIKWIEKKANTTKSEALWAEASLLKGFNSINDKLKIDGINDLMKGQYSAVYNKAREQLLIAIEHGYTTKKDEKGNVYASEIGYLNGKEYADNLKDSQEYTELKPVLDGVINNLNIKDKESFMILTNLVYNGDNKSIHSKPEDVVFMQKIMTTKNILGFSKVSFYASGLKYYKGKKIEDIRTEMKEIANKFSDPLKIMKEIEEKYKDKQKEMRESSDKNREFNDEKEPRWAPDGYKKYKLARCNQGVATTLGIIGIDTYTGEEDKDNGGNVTKDPNPDHKGKQIKANEMIEYLSKNKNFKSLYNIIGEEGFEQLSKLCKKADGTIDGEKAYEYLTKVMDFIYKLGYIGVGTMYNNDKKGGSGHVFMLFGNQSGDVNYVHAHKDNENVPKIDSYGTIDLYVSLGGLNKIKKLFAQMIDAYANGKKDNIDDKLGLNYIKGTKYENGKEKPIYDEYIYNFYYYNIPVYMIYNYGFTPITWNNQ